eukprot:TRINITY_DN88465_c0_g1_i1.p1 TRINITY_DN88465_c0_g1~~TRINITY_DN88465_c0_g1_i1.p1  ORF type:complete len:229 (-),score=18.92 TRINITY_DN88465_c0_g1_i1:115-801(-)
MKKMPMGISTYDDDFGGMDHWAVAAYAPGAGCAVYANVSDLPAGLRRRAEFVARDQMCGGYRTPRGHMRRNSSGSAVKRRKSSGKGSSCNQYNPFISIENPRGKFKSFPTSITKVLPSRSDPLGFTPYGPSSATGLPSFDAGDGTGRVEVRHQGIVPLQEGWQGAVRGRASRYPTGGYPIQSSPVLHSISATEDAVAPWRTYAELEDLPRGRASRFPAELDPYPAFNK